MSQIQGAGGQPQKQPKYAPIYTGRIFSGLVTNRSPLRSNIPAMMEQWYKLSYGDIMIAGSNVEVSNRLTLIRRPGTSMFATGSGGSGAGSFTNVQSFYEFPVNKAAADAFGLILEEIFTMISEGGSLTATLNGVVQNVFTNAAVTGQTYMQAIGNSLYFSNGVDNKKWLQSLINWAPNFQFQGANGLAGTYPFFSTYMLTGAISPIVNLQQIQQFIGIAAGTITSVQVASNVLTLTVNMNSPNTDNTSYPLGSSGLGSSFMLWGLTTETWLNGLIVTATNAYTFGGSHIWTLTAKVPHADYTNTADTGWIQQIGTTPIVAKTGATQPTWGTSYVPVTNNLYGASVANGGNLILDGNVLWINRGATVENWGIAAPDAPVTTSEANSTTVGWRPSTYYSAPGVFVDQGNVWQVTVAGTTGATNTFTASPVFGATITSGTATFKAVGTVAGTQDTWAPSIGEQEGLYSGAYPWPTATPEDGAFLPDWKSGKFILANSGGVLCLFMLQKNIPSNNINVPISCTYGGGTPGTIGWTCKFFNHANSQTSDDATHAGAFDLDYAGVGTPVLYGTATPAAVTASQTGVSSLLWDYYNLADIGTGPMKNYTLNSAGEANAATDTIPWAGMPAPNVGSGYEFCQYGKIRIPVDGMNVTFTVLANSTCLLGVEAAAGAHCLSFNTSVSASGQSGQSNLAHVGTRTLTSWNGYPILAGSNGYSNEYGSIMTFVINFPTAGVYGIEFDFARAYSGEAHPRNYFSVTANGSQIVPESAIAQPWFNSTAATPVWNLAAWNLLQAPQDTYPSVLEVSGNAAPWAVALSAADGDQLKWYNLGPVTDYAVRLSTPVTMPGVTVIDSNSNEETAYEAGVTGLTQPTWQIAKFTLTPDQSPLQWLNLGPIPPIAAGSGEISATKGWFYWIALVNTLDNTVSNLSPMSANTGPIVNGNITIPPGSGLPAVIDPQVDYVAIFRSTDGGSIPILIPGLGNSYWTVPLTQYIQNGYTDSTADVDLNDLITGAQAGENTPPLPGVANLTFHLGRGFYSIGNTVYYTSGATSPSGNGTGTSAANSASLPSRVVRLVPTAIGLLVFTVSDIYIIGGNGTPSSPILPAVPYLQGIGLANYNALDINGVLIGFFTTDKQFLIFDPSAGLSYVGYPIGDKFRLNDGNPGTSWNTATVSVAWYTNGEDQGWFVADGQFGWYKLINTPSPESGVCWSPFATFEGGAGTIASVQTSPGVHQLLIAGGTGNILFRDLVSTTDVMSLSAESVPYPAYAVFGSFILALPGQVAKIPFITTKSVNVHPGSPLVIGVILDEALPYYTGSFDMLNRWVNDPPNLKPSKSILSQRFYLSEDSDEAAYCSDMQLMVQWAPENAANELLGFTVWGAFEVEA